MTDRTGTRDVPRAAGRVMGMAPRDASPRRWRPLLWPLVLVAVIAVLMPIRDRLDKAHITLALLLVVLSAAADGGRRVGLLLAALAFVGFNWFFLPPYDTLVIADPLDWFVLLAFLGTSVVASHLFHRVQREAEEARARTGEVATLASLGAEAMTAPRADGALRVVANTARQALGVAATRVHVQRDDGTSTDGTSADGTSADAAPRAGLTGTGATPTTGALDTVTSGDEHPAGVDLEPVQLALARGARVAVLEGSVVRVIPHDGRSLESALAGTRVHRLLVPLLGGARTIGVLDVEDRAGLSLDGARERLLSALAYYAALGAERARLERTTEHLEALREADRMRSAVLASVSHDLRTPLTTIKALAHEMGTLGDERSEVIEQEADRLNRFVTDMLDMSRLASGRVSLQVAVTPVDELLSAALQQVEGSFGARRIAVRLPPGDALPLARFDLTHAVRIVVNLLENARKYAPGDAPVELMVAREGDRLAVHVADRGPGVAPGEAERIFEALYRPASSRPDEGSVGLGLAIARGLAEAQGGTLTYAPRDGGGSVFTLRLPAAELTEIDAG